MSNGYYSEVKGISFIGFVLDGVAYVGIEKSKYNALDYKELLKSTSEGFFIECNNVKLRLEELSSNLIRKTPYELMVSLVETAENHSDMKRPFCIFNSNDNEVIEIN